ncbi:hypothetical protein HOP51_14650 [Halomonas sp. MCCC 1A11036]|uniref:CN hydrolase domain-containing protein n=1 Tax=Billgrantia zhangzhouensis TaxID=2733481 RepID=A0ABS9AI80_9GAMM|nr:nitrilase-related carbon-nitrogen hydrolase [Halomonas zhangzhouensis]MCE8021338.1 hypothetical protein [Halomonas zhangzhouensis]
MPTSTTLLLCQPPTGLACVERLEWIEQALAYPSVTTHKLVVFPELFLSGYVASVLDPAAACRQDQALLEEIRHRCRTHRAWAVIGAVTQEANDYRNSAICIDAGGVQQATHHKCRPFGQDEEAAFTAGQGLTLVDTPLGCTGLAICFDVEDPQLIAEYAASGAEWLLVPTANMRPYTLVPGVKVRARALDNGLSIVYANYIGQDGELDFPGDSLVVGEQGEIHAQLGARPGLLAMQYWPG